MTRRRLLLGGVGVLLVVAAALTATTVPVSADSLVARAGNDYFLVAAIAGVGLLAAVAAAAAGTERSLAQTRMPEPERPARVPAPGEEFDDLVGGWRTVLPGLGRDRRAAVRDRLRADAAATLRRTAGYDRDGAEAAVADGEWTDDPVAAAFLAPDRPALHRRVLALLGGETWFRRGVRRTAAAIVELDDRDRATRAGAADGEGRDPADRAGRAPAQEGDRP